MISKVSCLRHLKESISKKNWGQYFTPLKVVRAIVNMVDLLPGMEVCDPACGVGKFLLEPICNDLHRFFLVEDGKLKPQIALHGFDKGFDKEEQKTIILAKANMLIYFSGNLPNCSIIHFFYRPTQFWEHWQGRKQTNMT